MQYVTTALARLREPSTWAGIAALLAIGGVPAATTLGIGDAVGQILAGLAALAAILLPERKPAP